MKYFLNVDRYPETPSLLRDIKFLGYDGLRRDVEDVEEVEGILKENEGAGLKSILLFNHRPAVALGMLEELRKSPTLWAKPFMVEVGNEWDTSRWWVPAKEAGEAWLESYYLVAERLITGGISSLKDEALEWLSVAAGNTPLPHVGFHPYRTTKVPSASELYPRLEALRKVVGKIPYLWNTECGWHTCKSKLSCFRSVQFSEQEVASNLKLDMALQKAWTPEGIAAYTVYQLYSGPNPEYYEDNFGIQRFDGTWRPSAFVLKGGAK